VIWRSKGRLVSGQGFSPAERGTEGRRRRWCVSGAAEKPLNDENRRRNTQADDFFGRTRATNGRRAYYIINVFVRGELAVRLSQR
jgi:hypothetical protein